MSIDGATRATLPVRWTGDARPAQAGGRPVIGRAVLRILILTPRQPQGTGNRVSACRQKKGLISLGHRVRIAEVEESGNGLDGVVEEFCPDVVHVLHARRSGKPWLGCRYAKVLPWAVTLTGTDVHHDLFDPRSREIVLRVLAAAGAIVAISPLTRAQLAANYPEWQSRLRHVPPAVDFGRETFALREHCGIPPKAVLFLHPAGIRPVKGNRELLEMFDGVGRARRCRLVFCGPLLDPDYGRRFLAALRKRPWAVYAGEIPPAAMPQAMQAADLVLNHSFSEGFSNVLQEAACLGVPILARNIPGNRVAFIPRRQGLLYDSAADFRRRALRFLDDPQLRRRFSRPTESWPDLRQEALLLEITFRQLCAVGHSFSPAPFFSGSSLAKDMVNGIP